MLRPLLFAALSLLAAHAPGAELVLYTYHDKPPYYLHAEGAVETPTGGLYAELVNILNTRQKELQLQLAYLPRRRMDRDIDSGTLNGAVIGVSPLWFKDQQQTKYLWTVPLMRDQDVIVVNKGSEFPYKHPRDLAGKTLSLARGYYFWGVTEMVGEGKVFAHETEGDANNFRMLLSHRVNATITSILTFRYYGSDPSIRDALTTLPVPHDQFERMILLPRKFEAQHKLLNRLLRDPEVSKAWLAALRKYGYDGAAP
jgi:polar amino acid transport system substrate-binding protein